MPQAEIPENAFEGLTIKSALGGGKQKKARYTGFYANTSNQAKMSVLKKSEDYPADNVAEVVTSSLLVNIIGAQNAIPYTFKKSADDGLYLQSEVRPSFKDLEQVLHSNLKKKNKKKKKNGFFPGLRVFPSLPRWGWLASNPTTQRNKKNIDACFSTPQLRKDMANVLAGCLLVLDVDCQVKNICFYTDTNGDRRIAKFDDGWGLADICKPENAKVDLFKSLKPYGDRATHKSAGLPTNHFIDYPYILHSMEFVDSLKESGLKAKNDLENNVNTSLQQIEDAYPDDPEGLKQAYKDFAAHLGVTLKSDNTDDIKNSIKTELSSSLAKRAESMLVLSEVLKIKLKIDNGEQVSVTHDCAELVELLKKHPNPKELLPDFEKAGKPFLQTNDAQQTLNQILNLAVITSQSKPLQASVFQPSASAPKAPLFTRYNHPASVLADANNKVATLDTFLKSKTKTELADKYHLEKFNTVTVGSTQSVELYFKDDVNTTHKAYIQPALASAEKGGVTYSMDSHVPADKQEQIINNLCKLAVDAALNTPNPEFDLTHTPPDKIESTKNALIAAIEANKALGLYTQDNPEPTIKQGSTIIYSPPAAASSRVKP